MMVRLVDQRKWLAPDEAPSKRYVIELFDGTRGEAETALTLFDLLCDPAYSDEDDRESQIMELARKLKDVAAYDLSAMGFRAQVWSGVGVWFDNGSPVHRDEVEEAAAIQFANSDPIVLDFWDEWTAMASLISCGYLKLYVRDEGLSAADVERLATDLTVFSHMAAETSEEAPAGYLKVSAEQFDGNEPTWKPQYVPRVQRETV